MAAGIHDFRWYCVRTAYGQERLADIEMRAAGFAVFSPNVWLGPTRTRRQQGGSIRGAQPARVVPLFPRYAFVQFCRDNQSWRQIKGLEGVEHILGAPATDVGSYGSPVPVSDAAIDWIRDLCNVNDCQYPSGVAMADLAAALPIEASASVRMISGAMRDRLGVCQWSDGKRVGLLMEILGQAVRLTVDRAAVEAA